MFFRWFAHYSEIRLCFIAQTYQKAKGIFAFCHFFYLTRKDSSRALEFITIFITLADTRKKLIDFC
jgi:hypothetical protein